MNTMRNISPCARGQIRAKSDPSTPAENFPRERLAGFFFVARHQVFLVEFLWSWMQNYHAYRLETLLLWWTACWMNGFCETKQVATALTVFQRSRRSTHFQLSLENRRIQYLIALLRKSKHLSLVPTLLDYASEVSWCKSMLALRSSTKLFACMSYCTWPPLSSARPCFSLCNPWLSLWMQKDFRNGHWSSRASMMTKF